MDSFELRYLAQTTSELSRASSMQDHDAACASVAELAGIALNTRQAVVQATALRVIRQTARKGFAGARFAAQDELDSTLMILPALTQ